MRLIGIKSSLHPEQLRNKLTVNPPLLELHLWQHDLDELEKTKLAIQELAREHPSMKLMLHTPLGEDDEELCIDGDYEMLSRFAELTLCDKQVIGAVMHPEQSIFNADRAKENITRLRSEHTSAEQMFYYENLSGDRTRKLEDFKSFIIEFGIKKVTVDLAHAAAFHSQEQIEALYSWLKAHNIEIYTHISDNVQHSGDTRPKHLGEGDLDFSSLVKLIDFGVIETYSSDELKGTEIKQDYGRYLKI